MAEETAVDPTIVCEVAYALPERQLVFTVTLPPEATAAEAVAEALRLGLQEQCPEIVLETAVLGVYGKVVSPQQRINSGDRVEIYRPLAADPRLARRARVKKAR